MAQPQLDPVLKHWLDTLKANRIQCLRFIADVEAHGNPTPSQWFLTSPEGPAPEYTPNELKVASTKTWLLRDAPVTSDSLVAAYNPVTDSYWNPDPSKVRLTDAGVFIARLTLPVSVRRYKLCHDFDHRGEIRRNRVPIGPTVILKANGVNWLPVYQHRESKHRVILTGGHNHAGWLIGDVPGLANFPRCFHAGLVVAPDEVVASGCISIQLRGYESLRCPDPRDISKIYEIAQNQSVQFQQRRDPEGYCLVLGNQSLTVSKMADLPGFSPYLNPASPFDVDSVIEIDPNRIAFSPRQIKWNSYGGYYSTDTGVPQPDTEKAKSTRDSSTDVSTETAEGSASQDQAIAVTEIKREERYNNPRAAIARSSNLKVAPQMPPIDPQLLAMSPTPTPINVQRPDDATPPELCTVPANQQVSIMSSTLQKGLLELSLSGKTQTLVYRDFDGVQKQKAAAMMFPLAHAVLLCGQMLPVTEASFIDMLFEMPPRFPDPPAHLIHIAKEVLNNEQLQAIIDAMGFWPNLRQLIDNIEKKNVYTYETEAERCFFTFWLDELLDCEPTPSAFYNIARKYPSFMEYDGIRTLFRQIWTDDEITSHLWNAAVTASSIQS
ncbi:unnamed protein product [Penicillium bialowiezense]